MAPFLIILLPMQLYVAYDKWPLAEKILNEQWGGQKSICIGFGYQYQEVNHKRVSYEKERIFLLIPYSVLNLSSVIIYEKLSNGEKTLNVIESPTTLFLNLALYIGIVLFLRYKGIPKFIKFIKLT